MSEQEKLEQAKGVFATLCRALKNEDWNFEKNEEKLSVKCKFSGEDFPIDIAVGVNARRSNVRVVSPMPFTIPEDKRLDVAVAVSCVNDKLVNGSFDFDITSGKMLFRIVNSFIDSTLGEAVFVYMLRCAVTSVDEYNDKFFMMGKGMLSLEQFLDSQRN